MEDYGGYWDRSGYGKITNSYAVGKVKGANSVGGLVGYAWDSTCSATNSYWVKETSGQEEGVVGTHKSVSALSKQGTYNNWDFTSTWTIEEGTSLAYLQGRSVPDAIYNLVSSYPVMAGKGTSDDPFIITNAEQLKKVSTDLTACYKLGANIDLSGIASWTPIGTEDNPFTGSFDGAGYTISNMKINYLAIHCQGLFGHINKASISNLTIKDFTIAPSKASSATSCYIGGLVGVSYSSNITNVNAIGNIYYGQGTEFVGGLVGVFENEYTTNASCKISKCYTEGEICYSTSGSVYTSYGAYVGGMVGQLAGDTKAAYVSDSYSAMNVRANSDVGGLVGRLRRIL